MKPLSFILSLILIFGLLTSISPPGTAAHEKQSPEISAILVPGGTSEAIVQADLLQPQQMKEETFVFITQNMSIPEGKQLKHPFIVAGTLPELRQPDVPKAKFLIPYSKRY